MIDSHCHLTDPRLLSQIDGVFARASALGVGRFITIGTSYADARAAIELCRKFDRVRCAVGIHPNYSHNIKPADFPLLREIQSDPSVVALGEMGLDYFHRDVPPPIQHEAFVFQLNLASELKRPVVIHSREAIADTLAHLRNYPGIRAVFHCFTGTIAEAECILAAGYYLGFTGPITYKKNDALRQVVRLTPEDRLLIETDSPYLAPEPVRQQKINEPGFVRYVGEMVGKIKGWTTEQVDAITTHNTEQFFGLKSHMASNDLKTTG